MSDRANVHDDVVYTNAFYAVAAFGAWGHPIAFCVTLTAGFFLALASSAYHATYERWAQRFDVWAMMTYFAALVSVLAGDWHSGFYGILPIAFGFYGVYTWEINSYIHVPIWAAVALAIIVGHAGVWALVPAAFFVVGGVIKLADVGSDTLVHSLWHVSGALAYYFALSLSL